MNNTAKYFLKLIKDMHCDSSSRLSIVKLMVDSKGMRYWCASDNAPKHSKHMIIVGVESMCNKVFFNASYSDIMEARSFSFQYPWKSWRNGNFNVDEISTEAMGNLLENVFTQMLMLSDRGMNILLGDKMFIKKNDAYTHIVNIDMMVE